MPDWSVESYIDINGYRRYAVVEQDSAGRVHASHGPFGKGQAETLAAVLRNTYARGRLAGKVEARREDSKRYHKELAELTAKLRS